MPRGIYQRKPRKPKVVSVIPITQEFPLKIELQLGASKFENTGPTVFDTLSNFPLDFTQVMVNGTFRIFRGGVMYERFMRLFEIRKVLRNPVNRKWWAKIFEENLNILEKK